MRFISAYILLLFGAVSLMVGCTEDATIHHRVLDTAAQQNVNYDSITHIDSIEAAVKYFDHHGTSNERMRAHYLLGCAYRDAGEAPKALECYQQAADCSESDNTDCDYQQMIRVYGQMGYLFNQQMLPYELLDAMKHQYDCALLAKDTLSAILAIEKKASAYSLLNQTDSVISIRKRAHVLYMEHGYKKEAAFVLGPVIRRLVEQNHIEEARKYIDIYETLSGIFKDGEVIDRKAIYYYIKGRYYLAAGKSDSAQILFRKLILPERTSNEKEAGYRGLYLYYKQTNQKDSLAKYADLSYQTSEENHAQKATDEMQRMQSLYNYSRSQRLAQQMAEKAHRNQLVAIGIAIVTILLIALFYRIYQKKRKEHQILMDQYHEANANIQRIRYEMECLEDVIADKDSQFKKYEAEANDAYHQLMDEKHKDILALQEKMSELEAALKIQRKKVTDEELFSTPIYKHIHDVLKLPQQCMKKKDWRALQKMIDEKIPHFYSEMNGQKGKMDSMDYNICILVRLHFSNGEIAFLTGNQPSTISMKRKRLLKRVYGIDGAPERFDEEIQKIGFEPAHNQ